MCVQTSKICSPSVAAIQIKAHKLDRIRLERQRGLRDYKKRDIKTTVIRATFFRNEKRKHKNFIKSFWVANETEPLPVDNFLRMGFALGKHKNI